ncbi:MAG: hypothetical protein ACYTEQ_25660, partial [Planctomycetota bacterium]
IMVSSLLVVGAGLEIAEQIAYGDVTVEPTTDGLMVQADDDFLFQAAGDVRDYSKLATVDTLQETIPSGAIGSELSCATGLVGL